MGERRETERQRRNRAYAQIHGTAPQAPERSEPAAPAPEGGGLPERAHMPEGGLGAYVIRVREHHGFVPPHGWCKCGDTLCPQAYLLAAIEQWRQAYEAKTAEFAEETRRNGELRAALAAAATVGGGLPEPTYSEREMAAEVDNRDRAEEWADWLAYAVAPVEVIGEHSSHNSPWENALAILQERPAGPGGGLDREAADDEDNDAAIRRSARIALLGELADHFMAHDGPGYVTEELCRRREALLAPLLGGGA